MPERFCRSLGRARREQTIPLGHVQHSLCQSCSTSGRRLGLRICLRRGCHRVFQARCWNQRYCDDPEYATITHHHDGQYDALGAAAAVAAQLPSYAVATHNHDASYAAIDHAHAGLYATVDHVHTGVYAPAAHDHDLVYAPIEHTHDGLYAPAVHDHGGEYAGANHSHDSVYSPLMHERDARYAALEHNHDAQYDVLGAAAAVQAMLASYALAIHNHDGSYAAASHNHDLVYAPLTHDHDASYAAVGHDHAGTYEPNIPAGRSEVFEQAFAALGVRSDLREPYRRFDGFDLAEERADAGELMVPPVLEQTRRFGGDVPIAGIAPRGVNFTRTGQRL